MKIHFASGTHPFPKPWVNIDPYHPADLDINLLYEFPETIQGIEWSYVGHFLEHLTIEEGILFLERIKERTITKGQIIVIGPDVEKAQKLFDQGRLPLNILEATKAHGSMEDPNQRGSIHLWDCTGHKVVEQLTDAGWSSVREFPINTLREAFPMIPIIDLSTWQFAVVAQKGEWHGTGI